MPRQTSHGIVPCRGLALFALVLALGGCSGTSLGAPEIRELYREPALREARNPVVVVHGILGARLMQRSTGKIVWGAFTKDAIDPNSPDGARALAVALPEPGSAMMYDPATADVHPTGPLTALDVGLLFGVISVDVYASILRALGVGGYVDPVKEDPATPVYREGHFTCFTFFYDWRRDNVENAIAFGRFLRETRGRVQRSARDRIAELMQAGTAEARHEAAELEAWLQRGFRFDVVAHSMGGLLSRYYLRYGEQDLPADGVVPEVTWAGAEQIDRLILVGTPSLGALDALERLLDGYSLAFFLPKYSAALLGTMPSIYQLLPRNANRVVHNEAGRPIDLDLFDVDVWERNEWGLLAPESQEPVEWLLPEEPDAAVRHRRARDYVADNLTRAKAFHAALDQEPTTPCPAELRLFAADSIETPTFAIAKPKKDGRLALRFHGKGTGSFGDQTVPRYSAIGDRHFGHPSTPWLDSPIPWDSVTFLPDDHVGLTKNPLFTNNLLFYLLRQEPLRQPPGPSPPSLETTPPATGPQPTSRPSGAGTP
ncbi:MAG: hypothetical protein AAF628_31755 [Planctomycetota bacterium]